MNFSGISIENMHWSDEFEYEPVAQEQHRSVTGALISFERPQPVGEKMTLTGAWVTRSVLKQLHAKRVLANQTHTVKLDNNRTFTVIFDRSGSSIETELIEGTRSAPENEDIYALTLNLQIIEETTGGN